MHQSYAVHALVVITCLPAARQEVCVSIFSGAHHNQCAGKDEVRPENNTQEDTQARGAHTNQKSETKPAFSPPSRRNFHSFQTERRENRQRLLPGTRSSIAIRN